jgi:predicted RecB family nuclease
LAPFGSGNAKSGAGEEGPEDLSKPKLHYAVQLALYTDILERLGFSAGRHPFVWDIHGQEVLHDLDALQGAKKPRTLWQDYQECLAEARQIFAQTVKTLPAYGGVCKQCWWYTECQKQLEAADDLTLLPELGRTKRDVLVDRISTVTALAQIDPDAFISGKKTCSKESAPTPS